MADPLPIEVRPYAEDDAAATLSAFLSAVMVTASADYSPEQIAAWAAPTHRNPTEWGAARAARHTLVAHVGFDVAGFADIDPEGHINMMFVAPRFGRKGVGSALLDAATAQAREWGAARLTTNASITARPFFEHHGFTVVAEHHPNTRGVRTTYFQMYKAFPRS